MSKESYSRNLFGDQISKNFGDQSDPENIWDKINYKLKLFHQNEGVFREDIISYEARNNYSAEPFNDGNNNCYASALGLFVTGSYIVTPGTLNIIYGSDGQSKEINYLTSNEKVFASRFRKGLKKDGILKDIPVSSIDDYFPIIGLSYKPYVKMRGVRQNDFHFIVPHIRKIDNDNDPSFYFTERNGSKGSLYCYKDETDMIVSEFCKYACKADVYLAPRKYMGLEIHFENREQMEKEAAVEHNPLSDMMQDDMFEQHKTMFTMFGFDSFAP